jgi:hypothetical protein
MVWSRPSPDTTKLLFRVLVFAFTLNLFSSILFISLVHRPVYDDSFNMFDVGAYAAHGISTTTVREQRNAAGPTSFIWMSLAVRAMRHDALFDARIAVLSSWLLLFFLTIVKTRHSEWAGLWHFGLLAALTFPHALTASATALTEGPALLFAYLGVIVWIEAVSRENDASSASLAWAILGGVSMGLAVTCRQYFLTLLPSAGLLALFLLMDRSAKRKLSSWGRLIIPLTFAVLPPLVMILIWQGITSPGMASGTSYNNYQAGLGLALFRPFDVVFYAALYLIPFSFPAMGRVPPKGRWPSLLIALVGGLLAMHFSDYLVNPGPLHSLLDAVSRIPAGAPLLLGLIASAAIYNAIAVGLVLWNERSSLRTCTPVIFAILVVSFFIVEQLGVGGNIPFYDRYILQLAPFLGIIGFWVSPRLTRLRILALAGLAVLSHGMLWRYAFIIK